MPPTLHRLHLTIRIRAGTTLPWIKIFPGSGRNGHNSRATRYAGKVSTEEEMNPS